MSSTDRLRRYVADECGSCTDEDLSERIAELEKLNDAAGGSDLETDIELLSALGNETRYRIVRILHAADADELCVCELSPLLDVSDSTISHALSKLTDAGLVTRRKEGKWRMYRATPRANAVLVALDGSRSL
ncbi:MAG: metalloregulator ArsR/SmtB family transcription factor [Halohasta sp.]